MATAKVTANIVLELDGATFAFSLSGNATRLLGVQDLGEYLKVKCDEQLGRVLGFDRSKRDIEDLKTALAEAEARLEQVANLNAVHASAKRERAIEARPKRNGV